MGWRLTVDSYVVKILEVRLEFLRGARHPRQPRGFRFALHSEDQSPQNSQAGLGNR